MSILSMTQLGNKKAFFPKQEHGRKPDKLATYWLRRSWGWQRLLAGGEGPALLMVHGLGGAAEDFIPLASGLLDSHTCIIPDLAGFGCSQAPNADYGVEFQSNDLAALAAELGLTHYDYIGHSMGGQIGMYHALEQAGAVDKLVLICPAGGHAEPRLIWRMGLRLFGNGRAVPLALLPYALPLLVRHVFGGPHPDEAIVLSRLRREWRRADSEARIEAFIGSARASVESPMWKKLQRLTQPVLTITGEKDAVTIKPHTDNLLKHLPHGCRHYEISACGHMPVYTHADRLLKEISIFL